jgi:hypothetical protein
MKPYNAEGSAWQREEANAAGILMRIEEGGTVLRSLYPAV